jgi:hypothetical protein
MTTERMCISRWVTKATYTQSEYVISIAFPLQQWLYELASKYVTRTLPLLLNVTTTESRFEKMQ